MGGKKDDGSLVGDLLMTRYRQLERRLSPFVQPPRNRNEMRRDSVVRRLFFNMYQKVHFGPQTDQNEEGSLPFSKQYRRPLRELQKLLWPTDWVAMFRNYMERTQAMQSSQIPQGLNGNFGHSFQHNIGSTPVASLQPIQCQEARPDQVHSISSQGSTNAEPELKNIEPKPVNLSRRRKSAHPVRNSANAGLKATTNLHNPAISVESPATSVQHPATFMQNPATSEWKSANVQWNSANAQWNSATAELKPPTCTMQKPANVRRNSATAELKPPTCMQKPANVRRSSATAELKPPTCMQKSANVMKNSAAPMRKPTNVERKPANVESKSANWQDQRHGIRSNSAAGSSNSLKRPSAGAHVSGRVQANPRNSLPRPSIPGPAARASAEAAIESIKSSGGFVARIPRNLALTNDEQLKLAIAFESTSEMTICKRCGNRFESENDLKDHMATVHQLTLLIV